MRGDLPSAYLVACYYPTHANMKEIAKRWLTVHSKWIVS